MKEMYVCFIVVFFGSRLIMVSDSIAVNCTETVIIGKYGSSVVLPCWLSPEIDAETLEIRWYRPGQFTTPLLFYQNRKVNTDYQEMYRNRSSLTLRNPQSAGLKQGDVSLRLDNLGFSDIGIFHCYVSGDKSYDDNTVELSLTALGSLPLLSLEHHQDSVNLSCSSCGWFPRPSLLWKSTKEKGDTLSDPRPPIYSEQGNGLYCIYSWIILSSSVSNSITCSVTLSEDEKRNVSLDLGARLSVNSSGVWKILFILVFCVLVLISIGFILYTKYKSAYMRVPKDQSATNMEDLKNDADQSATNMEDLKNDAVVIMLDKDNCKKDDLIFNMEGDLVRDRDEASNKYKGHGFPYNLCVHGKETFSSGRAYWEVGLKKENVEPKKSWLIGVAKTSSIIRDKMSDFDFTPSNGFWFLRSDPENGLHVNTEPELSLLVDTAPERVGVLLDYDNSKLSFYIGTDKVHLLTMKINFKDAVVPLFNPGIGDKSPLQIIKPQVKNEP
ncbi:butyrophilin subfamily 1 member A1-like isoform X2 [Neoarius graeffei]|uniref:butyrophilin subfamily 1 member A1-like isoform X2 n=1 Tax=Neoarius graeffei TaxID=443677 RepID=UPI00298CCB57|nr:butyrophilin subfamily 1 member A1-like isoform X2 [Neoarius graeffei]